MVRGGEGREDLQKAREKARVLAWLASLDTRNGELALRLRILSYVKTDATTSDNVGSCWPKMLRPFAGG